MKHPVYLDYQASTPLDPRVLEVIRPWLEDGFGNPHSEHAHGWQAARAVEKAAESVARLIGAAPGEIVFTSGATEANNLALQGIARSARRRGDHIVVSAIEHKCVLSTAAWLRGQGFRIETIPVNRTGLIDLDALACVLAPDTALVSVMTANNEIGVIQPVAEVGALCRAHGIPFHTDAAQAAGKIPLDIHEQHIDMLSLSGHKMYGPKGIGALYVAQPLTSILQPLIMGGAQQSGLRAGTLPTFLSVGLGAACHLAGQVMENERNHCLDLRNVFLNCLQGSLPEIEINGDLESRLSGNLNLRFPGVDADSLLIALHEQLSASTGSACNSGFIEPSYVLQEIGLNGEQVKESIRFSFGRNTTKEEVLFAATSISEKIVSSGTHVAAE